MKGLEKNMSVNSVENRKNVIQQKKNEIKAMYKKEMSDKLAVECPTCYYGKRRTFCFACELEVEELVAHYKDDVNNFIYQ